MDIEILSPVKTIFSGKVDSVIVPGESGSFHMLNNHAALVSLLGKGNIEIFTNQPNLKITEQNDSLIPNQTKPNSYFIPIENGVIEFNHNKLIILVE